jgi:large-conductance mechanosensitive channel
LFQKKPLIYIILSLLIFLSIIEITSFYIGYKEATKRNFINDTRSIQNALDSQELTLKTIASFLSKDKSVLKAYKYNNPELLKNHIYPIWKDISKKQYIHEIHFFKPPAISFVNFSNFKSLGKDVTDTRSDIRWITSSFKTSTHTLMCKTYAGIRATYPIIDENKKVLGGLSIGRKLDWLAKTIKKDTHHDAFLIYKKESTKSLSFKYYKEFMKNKKVVGKYIFADTTSDISPNIIKSINFNKDIQKISVTNSSYFFYRYPIVDFNGNIMAYIFTLDDINIYYKEFFKIFIKNLFLFSITALIIFFIVKYFLNNVNKQLQKNIDTLNDAQRTAQIGSYLYNIKSKTLEWSDEHYRLFKINKNFFTPSAENFLSFVHPKDKELIQNKYHEVIHTKKRITFQYSIILNDGKMLDVESTSQIVKYSELNEPLVISGTIQNISELKKLERENQNKSQELIKQLYTDKLTNISNRATLIHDMEQNKEAFIAIINIRSFKNINDVFGFNSGNFILKELAQLLTKMLSGKNIFIYRIGNDEFALINNKNILKKDFEQLVENISKK